MVETKSHNETMTEDGYIDLMDSMNSATVEELKERGPIGDFVVKLLDKARTEKKQVWVKGVNDMTTTVKYGDETADFILRASVDQGDAPIEHAHYELWMADYKKPWVRELIKPEESGVWLQLLPINFADLTKELTGRDLKLNVLEEQFPKLTYSEMMKVIGEETDALDEFFTYKQGGKSAGAWGFYMMFKDEEMYQKYLRNDPEVMGKLRNAADGFVPKIMARLQELSAKKAA